MTIVHAVWKHKAFLLVASQAAEMLQALVFADLYISC